MINEKEFEKLRIAVQHASTAILNIYNSAIIYETKSDNSPLTQADLQSNEIISQSLRNIFPSIPIISEETKALDFSERKQQEFLWLVDPLDGTKEFIKRNGEFTINIALLHNNKPVFGLIAQPLTGLIWHNLNGFPVKLQHNKEEKLIANLKLDPNQPINIISSRSHLSNETEEIINRVKQLGYKVNTVNAGSALKFCLICENKAHLYPRLAPTMEWDCAAGQALVQSFGGQIIDLNTKLPMSYNKESLVNNFFIASHPASEHILKQLL